VIHCKNVVLRSLRAQVALVVLEATE